MNQEFFLKTSAQKQGLYLSQQQIDLLFIVSCEKKEQLEAYFYKICSQFPYQTIEEVIPNYNSLDDEQAKRALFTKYQEVLIGYKENYRMSIEEQVSYKLDMMRTPRGKTIPDDIKEEVLRYISTGKIDDGYRFLTQNYGKEFIVKFNRLMKDDFENIKSISYEDIEDLHERIKDDRRIDTIIIATSKYDNCVFNNGESSYFDPFYTSKGLAYCKMTGKHMRFHAIFDYAHLKKLVESGKGPEDKEKILEDMKNYARLCFEYITDYNNSIKDTDAPRIEVVEIFNELVEYNKDKTDLSPYQMAWEKYFGITIDDILSCFEDLKKPENVEFMYNETQLEEHPDRRRVVEEVINAIMEKRPDLIDVFGNQMHLQHTHADDNSYSPTDSLVAVKDSLKLMKDLESKTFERTDKDGSISRKKLRTEITEFDIHICKETYLGRIIPMLQSGELTKDDIVLYKEAWIRTISNAIKESRINIDRITYWSIYDTVDHNLVRANQSIMKDHPDMTIEELEQAGMFVDNLYAGLLGSGTVETKDFKTTIELPEQENPIQEIGDETPSEGELTPEEPNVEQPEVAKEKPKKLSYKPNFKIPNSGFITEYILLGIILTILITLVVLTIFSIT